MTGGRVSRHPKASVFGELETRLRIQPSGLEDVMIMVQNKRGRSLMSWIWRDYIPLDLNMILQRTLLNASLHHQIAVGQLMHGAMLPEFCLRLSLQATSQTKT